MSNSVLRLIVFVLILLSALAAAEPITLKLSLFKKRMEYVGRSSRPRPIMRSPSNYRSLIEAWGAKPLITASFGRTSRWD